jgi:hypothetical protein
MQSAQKSQKTNKQTNKKGHNTNLCRTAYNLVATDNNLTRSKHLTATDNHCAWLCSHFLNNLLPYHHVLLRGLRGALQRVGGALLLCGSGWCGSDGNLFCRCI